uniref:Uncharacterized protein n=1 Tax=Haptolina ericina TaxID=156174 RepID=A0A7S3C0Z2_9EUKA|mmetsp:Transcript_73172/g.162503  ORF Transcript_73172/g.162503 Transcript_73172/m.162503 type:complete len:229 (+) Transcript_73172:35-721(+)|eukprot:CAMPEP_0181222974 /NCGR_PEP_ID=MMETSP1096-20121128/30262_1 /TAXON_ID=156174 ORGANISM="Chrysochromulina ericina, Strain CCMP281" /NCGR_SAMPLE_ID=MMETSP1096 /ASSEMBLY_ACC=CAM_ASM_000453 /LENGTH=228 /DNA_ID=CAMNT_0023315791 /DNA_START=31 /DNA_END=717 /DNA_ORIENTATION=-
MAYTFKDDGSALTYYREYNKEVGTGDKTLVGNWVEERALRDNIKTGRYQIWTDTTSDPKAPQKTYSKFTTRPDTLDTLQRTMAHSDHLPPSEFVTSNQVTPSAYAVYVKPEKGVREQLLEQRAKELALASGPEPEQMPSQFFSTTKQDFVAKDLPPVSELGRRVMMTQNMEDIKGAGDGLFRKEHDIVARHLVLEAEESEADKMAKSRGKVDTFSTPITSYLKGHDKD